MQGARRICAMIGLEFHKQKNAMATKQFAGMEIAPFRRLYQRIRDGYFVVCKYLI
jgi:hypothetical protein